MQYKYQKKAVLRIKNKNLKLCIGNRVKSHRVKIPKPSITTLNQVFKNINHLTNMNYFSNTNVNYSNVFRTYFDLFLNSFKSLLLDRKYLDFFRFPLDFFLYLLLEDERLLDLDL